jgi:D-sedoheptulose 7-phosphate isomerase
MMEIGDYLAESQRSFEDLHEMAGWVNESVERIYARILAGGTVYWMGNGGSAGDAQHLATELVAKFAHDRKPIRSVSFTTNTSLLTSIGNDLEFERIFFRQVETFVVPNDVVIGISTSGKSMNVISALELAKKIGAMTIGLTGSQENPLEKYCDFIYKAPSNVTGVIQQLHITIGQAICLGLENKVLQSEQI